ncbi:hypothetical protein VCHC50A2_3191B, partial [Vibrio cholerae HC-50A2]
SHPVYSLKGQNFLTSDRNRHLI